MNYKTILSGLLVCSLVAFTLVADAAPINNMRTSVSPARVRIVLDSKAPITYKQDKNGLKLTVNMPDSSGQKQMISIARTILSKSEVILLDDITTSLDPDTAKLVPKLINELKKDHTIIMVTKKPDLMRMADRIVVCDNGNISAVGTHKQLLEQSELYRMLQSRKSPSRIGVFDND